MVTKHTSDFSYRVADESTAKSIMDANGLKSSARRCHELPLKVTDGVPARTGAG